MRMNDVLWEEVIQASLSCSSGLGLMRSSAKVRGLGGSGARGLI